MKKEKFKKYQSLKTGKYKIEKKILKNCKLKKKNQRQYNYN